MDVQQPHAGRERGADRLDRGRIAPLREVRHRLERQHGPTLGAVKAYYEARAREYDDWWLGKGAVRRNRPADWDARARCSSNAGSPAPAGAHARRRLRDRLHDPAPPRARSSGSTRARACSRSRAEQAPDAEFVQGDALDLPFADGSFDRVFTSYFYGHLEEPERRALPRRGAARRAGARRRRDVLAGARMPDALGRARAQGRLAVGGLQALFVRRRAGGGARRRRVLHAGDCSSWSRHVDPAPLLVPIDRLAPARQPRLPRLRRGRLSALLAARRPAVHGPARVHPRPGARRRRRRAATAVARPSRADAPPLARARRGRVLRDLLLRLGDALLPGPRCVGKRRPDADTARAGALLALARVGAPADPAGADPRRSAASRARRLLGVTQPRRVDRPALRAGRRHGDPAAAPVRHQHAG